MGLIREFAEEVYQCNLDKALLIIDNEKLISSNNNLLSLYEAIIELSFYEKEFDESRA